MYAEFQPCTFLQKVFLFETCTEIYLGYILLFKSWLGIFKEISCAKQESIYVNKIQ